MAVNATAVWRVRPSGNNNNGAGYDSAISGAGTDYSQQNAAQASGTHGSGAGTTTFTDTTAAAFTSAMVGNCINIQGQGFYFVVTFTDSSHVVVDRALGTFSGATWALGGGWADFWTNTTLSAANLVPGNTVYILGSGTPNPSSYVYDYTLPTSGNFTPVRGTNAGGMVTFANDPATPGYKAAPDTTGGMPCIQPPDNGSIFASAQGLKLTGLYFVARNSVNGDLGIVRTANIQSTFFGCVLDQFGFDYVFVGAFQASDFFACIGCEVFNSQGGSGTGTRVAISGQFTFQVIGCNIHDTLGPGINTNSGAGVFSGNIIAKCVGTGITVAAVGNGVGTLTISGNTIDGNTGNGIEIADEGSLAGTVIINNIISNHTGGGKSGLVIDVGSAALNNSLAFADYNVYYNNTADVTAISYGPHDTHGGSNPYVNQATENYTLA